MTWDQLREDDQDWASCLESSTMSALLEAGWYAGRDVGVAGFSHVLEMAGYAPNPRAARFLRALLGLKVGPAVVDGPNFSNDEPFLVDPVGIGKRHGDEAMELGSVLGGEWCPIGWWLAYSHVFMESSGAMVAHADGLIWDLGRSPFEGLDMMVSASRPLVCVHASAGVTPWPRV